MRNTASEQAKLVLGIVAANRQFPTLVSLSLELGCGEDFHFENTHQWSNKILRHLTIDGCRVPNCQPLLQAFPNLLQLQIHVAGSPPLTMGFSASHSLLSHIRVTVNNNLLPDLESLLQSTPNVKRLHLRGELTSDNVLEQFERMVHLFMRLTSHLVKFDCQLFCYTSDQNGYDSVIRDIHPLFRDVRFLLGPEENRCYATDIRIYPNGNKYQRKYHKNHRFV